LPKPLFLIQSTPVVWYGHGRIATIDESVARTSTACHPGPFIRVRHVAKSKRAAIALDQIERSILVIRGQKVMLDSDLAALYGVETKRLLQAVKRNRSRFPDDFAYQRTTKEVANLRSQFVTSSSSHHGGRRYAPFVFTEQGVAMLSSVLRSPRAVQVNIEIMRAFVRLREILASHKDLSRRLDELEQKYDKQFAVVFDAIRQLMTPPTKEQREMGYHTLIEKR
jgi:phage regulator Rha-like protein